MNDPLLHVPTGLEPGQKVKDREDVEYLTVRLIRAWYSILMYFHAKLTYDFSVD